MSCCCCGWILISLWFWYRLIHTRFFCFTTCSLNTPTTDNHIMSKLNDVAYLQYHKTEVHFLLVHLISTRGLFYIWTDICRSQNLWQVSVFCSIDGGGGDFIYTKGANFDFVRNMTQTVLRVLRKYPSHVWFYCISGIYHLAMSGFI